MMARGATRYNPILVIMDRISGKKILSVLVRRELRKYGQMKKILKIQLQLWEVKIGLCGLLL